MVIWNIVLVKVYLLYVHMYNTSINSRAIARYYVRSLQNQIVDIVA